MACKTSDNEPSILSNSVIKKFLVTVLEIVELPLFKFKSTAIKLYFCTHCNVLDVGLLSIDKKRYEFCLVSADN